MNKTPTQQTAALKLFHSRMWVKPTPGHPRYWEVEFGILHIWIYAESTSQAHSFVSHINAILPYQLSKSRYLISEVEEPLNPAMQWNFKISVVAASLAGLVICLEPWETGKELPPDVLF